MVEKNPTKCPNSAQPVECPVCAKFNEVSGLRHAKVSRNFARAISHARFRTRNFARWTIYSISRKSDTLLGFAWTLWLLPSGHYGTRHSLRVSRAAVRECHVPQCPGVGAKVSARNPIKCPKSVQPVECPVCVEFNEVSGLRHAKVSRDFARAISHARFRKRAVLPGRGL